MSNNETESREEKPVTLKPKSIHQRLDEVDKLKLENVTLKLKMAGDVYRARDQEKNNVVLELMQKYGLTDGQYKVNFSDNFEMLLATRTEPPVSAPGPAMVSHQKAEELKASGEAPPPGTILPLTPAERKAAKKEAARKNTKKVVPIRKKGK